MNHRPQHSKSPKQAVNPAFLKQPPNREEMERFCKELALLMKNINEAETEEYNKNLLRDFLNAVYYKNDYEINAYNDAKNKIRVDFAVRQKNRPFVEVLVEVKRPVKNQNEMPSLNNLNKRALHELLLYYMSERVNNQNKSLRHLIVTNLYEWFVFDAKDFYECFYNDSAFRDTFNQYFNNQLEGDRTTYFYTEIAPNAVEKVADKISFVYFDLRLYQSQPVDSEDLIALYKFLSPVHLLKRNILPDNNRLNKEFYNELLHILGLTETPDDGKIRIERKTVNRHEGSLLELTISQLETTDIANIDNLLSYGETRSEQLFEMALSLIITWINRALFMKLLEAQLLKYYNNHSDYSFLSTEKINTFSKFNALFFMILAQPPEKRPAYLHEFVNIPYLNSSLFEETELEKTLKISQLSNEVPLPLYEKTVLKGRPIDALHYLLQFLNAYNFSGIQDADENPDKLISASVLGLIFEKINGYKDGSFFTPSFITMYMCRETIRRAVIRKFKIYADTIDALRAASLHNINDLYNIIPQIGIERANRIFNEIRICDPAVGSGHFLVSALNELIALKSELGILCDRNGKTLWNYTVAVENDELMIRNPDGDIFAYNPKNAESRRIQETLFHEKQTVIENCLFGVDINPNSVKICRLRLWIELLKHAEAPSCRGESKRSGWVALPNIDINIKCGNSLMSRFDLTDTYHYLPGMDIKLRQVTKKYKEWVSLYKSTDNKETKREIVKNIETEKGVFYQINNAKDPDYQNLKKAQHELALLTANSFEAFQTEQWQKKIVEVTENVGRLEALYNEKIHSCFEWRFEFPEVLDDDGNFTGFDVVIGNPPYIRLEHIRKMSKELETQNYKTFDRRGDLYGLFVERGFQLLKTGGYVTFIMPNKWMQTGYGKPVRELLLTKRMINLVDLGAAKVFDEAGVTVCIYLAQNEDINLAEPFQRMSESSNQQTVAGNHFTISVLPPVFDAGFAAAIKQMAEVYEVTQFSSEPWVISSQKDKRLFEKIQRENQTLEQFIDGEAYYGVKTGLTEAFIIDEQTKNRLIVEDENSAALIKPVLLGRDAKPYFSAQIKKYLLLIPKGITNELLGKSDKSNAWKIFENHFPAVAHHLLTYQTKAEKRTDRGDYWWELRACDYYWVFEKTKIIYQKFQRKPCFIYDEKGLYCNDSMWIIPTDNKFLLAILNSKMGWWLIRKCCSNLEGMYQLIWQYFGKFPVPAISLAQQQSLTVLVEQILTAKKENPATDTSDLESRIDELVYTLYGLTDEEKIIVE